MKIIECSKNTFIKPIKVNFASASFKHNMLLAQQKDEHNNDEFGFLKENSLLICPW